MFGGCQDFQVVKKGEDQNQGVNAYQLAKIMQSKTKSGEFVISGGQAEKKESTIGVIKNLWKLTSKL